MTVNMSSYARAESPVHGSAGAWMAKRGVLLLLLQVPIAAVVLGYGLRLVSLPVACLAVFVSAAAFPAWASHRMAASDDPNEPVHHLHRHALRAAVVVAGFTPVVATALIVTGSSVLHLWYDLGAELTAEPSGAGWSLIAGLILYCLVAVCTATSCSVLLTSRPDLRESRDLN
jgi:hypothetical protein